MFFNLLSYLITAYQYVIQLFKIPIAMFVIDRLMRKNNEPAIIERCATYPAIVTWDGQCKFFIVG